MGGKHATWSQKLDVGKQLHSTATQLDSVSQKRPLLVANALLTEAKLTTSLGGTPHFRATLGGNPNPCVKFPSIFVEPQWDDNR